MNIQQTKSTTTNNNTGQNNDLFQGWSLDDEIDIFGENDWKFIDITVQDNNIEYFNDIRDTQFDGSGADNSIKQFMVICIFVFIFAVLTMLAIQWSGVLDRRDYDKVANIQSDYNGDSSVASSKAPEKIGEVVDDSDLLVEVSENLSEYFASLQSGNLEILNEYAFDSSVGTMYSERKKEIKTTYDVNDCYARLIKYLATHTKVGKINEIRKEGDTYYVYVNIALTTETDVSDFIYRNKMNFVKNFNTVELTKENIMKYILKVLETDSLGVTSSEHCLKMQRSTDGRLILVDDTVISQVYTDTYKELLERIVQIVGGDLENMEY